MRVLIVLLLAGCAARPAVEYRWVADRPTNRAEFERDFGQCEAQALAHPGTPMQRGMEIFAACMRGKGWSYVQQ